MKTALTYIANDGTHFDNEKDAKERDDIVRQVDAAMHPLGKIATLSSDEFIQHDRYDCMAVKRDVFNLAKKLYGTGFACFSHDADDVHPLSVVGRILDDCGGPLSKAWSRLARINWENYREYQQVYYAMHPNEATTRVDILEVVRG